MCEGNSSPVENDGWKRLRKIQGAGDSVPAKRGMIGAKKHGLKTAFTIGDEIRLLVRRGRRSSRRLMRTVASRRTPVQYLNLCPIQKRPRKLAGSLFDTGPQRLSRLTARQPNWVRSARKKYIEVLFQSACTSTPQQFAVSVSPEVKPRYEIVLRHWRLGEA